MISYAHRMWNQICRSWPELAEVSFDCVQGPAGFTRYEWGVRDGEPVITRLLLSLPPECTREDVKRVIAYEAARVLKTIPSVIDAIIGGDQNV